MKDIGYEDVSSTVWDKVYKKWKFAAENGWSPSLWSRCPLCDHVMEYSWFRETAINFHLVSFNRVCKTCPIYKRQWCRSVPAASKLHIDYSVHGDIWKKHVLAFLREIKPHTSMEQQK